MPVRKRRREKNRFEPADAYAHRGFHSKPEIPENSMAAFRRAVANGMASELDVHLISDGTLVVFHDDDLERETGVKGSIESYDYPALSRLRLEGTDERIPTFDEVLDLYEDSGLALLIELKVVGGNHKALARAAAKRLKSYKGRFAVQSFYPRAIMEFRKHMPDVALGQLSKNYFDINDGFIKVFIAMIANRLYNKMVDPDFVAYKLRDRTNRGLNRAIDKKSLGRAAWTIRSAKAYREAVRAGCIPIFENIDPRDIEDDEPDD